MSPTVTEEELLDAFMSALKEVGLSPASTTATRETGYDFVVDEKASGKRLLVECRSTPQAGDVVSFERVPANGYKVMAAKRISEAVRDELAAHGIGFFDGRGHLRLVEPPLVVDTPVTGLSPAMERQRTLRVDSGAVLDVALAAMAGEASQGIRSLAERIRRAPGTVSKSLKRLRHAGLVNEDNTPVIPDLFNTVADGWRPQRHALASIPEPGGGAINDQLELGFDPADDRGWVLADVFAAAAWGAPAFIDSTRPPDFYVPSALALAKALALLGKADFGGHRCTVAVPPSPDVCSLRFDRRTTTWPTPSPVVAALDLAVDPGRGRELLDDWSQQLPAEVNRVW